MCVYGKSNAVKTIERVVETARDNTKHREWTLKRQLKGKKKRETEIHYNVCSENDCRYDRGINLIN